MRPVGAPEPQICQGEKEIGTSPAQNNPKPKGEDTRCPQREGGLAGPLVSLDCVVMPAQYSNWDGLFLRTRQLSLFLLLLCASA